MDETTTYTDLTPAIPLKPGENYRFHFDANKCIGCKCCEVACHEQNNNPPDVKWRRVGEIESGSFPETKNLHISMACNHCLDPACLNGCPVDAYTKDPVTGIVSMKEDACIGCQYCTWNCPYGAPQFNKERHMVTKCDMCHNRIAEGKKPACVEACPSEALTIEQFNVEAWKKDFSQANAPGVPDAAITLSTTRITFLKDEQQTFARLDEHRIQPEHPHYSLILLTVLTQLSVGGFTCLFTLEWMNHLVHLPPFFTGFVKIGHLAMLGMAFIALNTSVFHLGRPIHAIRALKMWRRSWLSREVLFFTLFAGSATLYSLLSWQTFIPVPVILRWVLGVGVMVTGLAGVFCSAMIYRVPARPSWNTLRTPIAFMATAFILGPMLALVVFSWFINKQSLPTPEIVSALNTVGFFLTAILLLAGFIQLGAILVKILYPITQDEPELIASARMLTQRFKALFLSRLGILLLAILITPLVLFSFVLGKDFSAQDLALWFSALLTMTLFSEFAGRYLFFVTVVPKRRPEGFFK